MEQHYKVELNYIKYIFGKDTLTQKQIDYLSGKLGKENFEKLKELRKKFEDLDPATKEKMMRDLGILIMWYGLPSFVKSELPRYLGAFIPGWIKDIKGGSLNNQSQTIIVSKEKRAMLMHDNGIREELGFKNSNWREKLFEYIKNKGYWKLREKGNNMSTNTIPKPNNKEDKASEKRQKKKKRKTKKRRKERKGTLKKTSGLNGQ